ncbi:MAG: YneF family protein [Mycoplasmataceae bacterium]|jgi:uncharacterized protein YneF (UPF0154 family)|nr:YneF family protein [Mycoplasmataceae bacterium]
MLYGLIFGCIGTLIIGGIIGYFIALKFFKKKLHDNPPINENQIRALYAQVGRKPTEAQVNQAMKAFKNNASK